MSYQNLLLCCMSGTGNSYRAACWIEQQARLQGLSYQIVPINHSRPEEIPSEDLNTLVGILMPTHAFTAPWLVFRLIARLPRRSWTHAFCLASRAGMKVGPFLLPGINGSGNFLISLLLALKGYHMRGVMSVDMPCNWIALHPGIKQAYAHAIIQRAQPKVSRFITRLFSGKSVWFTRNNLYELFWGTLLFPITVLYLLISRFFLAKLFFANHRCNGCRLCEQQCPLHAIRMIGCSHPPKYNCESCMHCMAYCPEAAVEASHPWAVALYMMTSVPITAGVLYWIRYHLPFFHQSDSIGLNRILNLLWRYFVFFSSHYVFHALSRFTWINRLLSYTTQRITIAAITNRNLPQPP